MIEPEDLYDPERVDWIRLTPAERGMRVKNCGPRTLP
jgi:hypothetical protein